LPETVEEASSPTAEGVLSARTKGGALLFPGSKDKGTPIPLPNAKSIGIACLALGAVFWIIGLVLWGQQGIDRTVLFYYNAMRIANDPIIILSQWLSSYGMALVTVIFVVYLLVSQRLKSLDAPLTLYFYTICSYGLSGIAGDIVKAILARPRPAVTFGSEILALSQSAGFTFPSGHATKSIALILPFILLVSNSKNLHKAIGIVIAFIVGGVCFSRIVLGAHYVSDVVAGIGIALIGLPCSMLLANVVLRKAKQERLPFLSRIWGTLLIFLTYIFMIM
jgi:membrane-associated phospholipid phosphatase